MIKNFLVCLVFTISSTYAFADSICPSTKTLVEIDTAAATTGDYQEYLRFMAAPGIVAELLSGGTSFFLTYNTNIAPEEMIAESIERLKKVSSVKFQIFCDTPTGVFN